MGVISFGVDRQVWGSSSSFIRQLVDQAIAMHGAKDYLRHFRHQMEWGYGSIAMEELNIDEIREFAMAIEPIRARYLATPDLQETVRESVEQLTDELTTALRVYEAQRIAAGKLTVERDFWTLRQAADEESRLQQPPATIVDIDKFLLDLAERTHGKMRLEMARAPRREGHTLAGRLAEIGSRIGGNPDTPDDPKAAFHLIEDGLDSENEELFDSLLRHLVPAMVEASVKAGTWEALQQHLGAETRKWAMEHHNFECETPEAVGILPGERQRLRDLVAAASASDWDRFRALSDAPSINEAALKESFEAASALIRNMKVCRIVNGGAAKARGDRMVVVSIGDPADKPRIQVTLNNIGGRDGGPFSVWTFHPALDFS